MSAFWSGPNHQLSNARTAAGCDVLDSELVCACLEGRTLGTRFTDGLWTYFPSKLHRPHEVNISKTCIAFVVPAVHGSHFVLLAYIVFRTFVSFTACSQKTSAVSCHQVR